MTRIEETLQSLKQAKASFEELLEISGRSGAGMLSDLAKWWMEEETSSLMLPPDDFIDQEDHFLNVAYAYVKQARNKSVDWGDELIDATPDVVLEKTSEFIRYHLEDCIDALHQAIIIIEEEART